MQRETKTMNDTFNIIYERLRIEKGQTMLDDRGGQMKIKSTYRDFAILRL